MKIFATGTTGTIGSKLPTTIEPITGDLKEIAKYPRKQEFVDSTIIHLAGVVGTEKVLADKQHSEKVNIEYTMDLATVAAHHHALKFIYISSGHVYGITQEPAIEDQPLNPMTLYAEQKSRAEEKLKDLFKESNTTLYILRVFSVIDFSSQSVSLGGQIRKIIDGEKDIWINNGDDIRDFLPVNKVSEILATVAISESPGGVYNVCSGNPVSVSKIANSALVANGILNYPHIKGGFSSMRSNFGSREKLLSTFYVGQTLNL